jgi:hypothetical protein
VTKILFIFDLAKTQKANRHNDFRIQTQTKIPATPHSYLIISSSKSNHGEPDYDQFNLSFCNYWNFILERKSFKMVFLELTHRTIDKNGLKRSGRNDGKKIQSNQQIRRSFE